jgi:hypothetical protein
VRGAHASQTSTGTSSRVSVRFSGVRSVVGAKTEKQAHVTLFCS